MQFHFHPKDWYFDPVNLSWYRDMKQGTSQQCAQFNVGLLGLKFTYFLKLTHEPKYNTLTWTLDYTKNSDFGEYKQKKITAGII